MLLFKFGCLSANSVVFRQRLLYETKIYFQIIVEAVRGSDGDSDIAIDEILLFHGPCRMYTGLIFVFCIKLFSCGVHMIHENFQSYQRNHKPNFIWPRLSESVIKMSHLNAWKFVKIFKKPEKCLKNCKTWLCLFCRYVTLRLRHNYNLQIGFMAQGKTRLTSKRKVVRVGLNPRQDFFYFVTITFFDFLAARLSDYKWSQPSNTLSQCPVSARI